MLKEPTIHQIEELLRTYRLQGGSDAEINAIAQDIIRDYRPETIRPVKEVFGGGRPEKIEKIVKFKNDGQKPLHQALSVIWRRWYIKFPIIFIAVFGAIFAVANLPLFLVKSKPIVDKKEVVSSAPVKEKEKVITSAPLEPGEVIAATPTLVVPKIGVTAPIGFVESTEEAAIQTGLQQGVVHYFQTAFPGKVGNSFITGHSSNYWWDKGAYNYVFANLDKLVVGDQAKIYYQGNKYLYQVTNVKVVEATEMAVLDQTSTPTMTLMTCTPPGTSWKRLIVSFDQISPAYKPTLVTKDSSTSTTTVSKDKPKTNPEVTTSLPKSDSNPIVDWLIGLFSGSN